MDNMERLKKGDFNHMTQIQQDDGSVIITLTKEGENEVAKFRVRDLCKPGEQEVDIDSGKPITNGDLSKTVSSVSGEDKGTGKGKTNRRGDKKRTRG